MEVISGSNISKMFKRIPEYKRDLGMAIKIDDSRQSSDYKSGGGEWKVKDRTIKHYYENFGNYPVREGKIGTLLFYVDYSVNDNAVYIMNDDGVLYQFLYNHETEIRDYLSKILKRVLDGAATPITGEFNQDIGRPDLKNMSNEELVEYLTQK